MSRNITWCFLRKLTEKFYLSRMRIPAARTLTFNHAIQNVGYDHQDFDYHEVKTYKQFSDHHKVGLGRSVTALQKILDISKEDAIIAANECSAFSHLSMATIFDSVALLRDMDVKKSTLKSNTYALADTTKNVKRKLEFIKMIDLDIDSAIKLLRLSTTELSNLATTTIYDRKHLLKYRNRLQYLSEKLKIELSEICIRCTRNRHLLHVDIKKLEYVTEFLLDIGMLPESIIEGFDVYRYSIERIKKRMTEAKMAGIDPLKGWVVKCPRETIINIGKRHKRRCEIVESVGSIENYFAQILNCDVELINVLMSKLPWMESRDIDKFAQKLKLLRNAGYTAEDIFRSRIILQYSVDTLRERLGKWKYFGLGKLELCKLSKAERIFDRMVQDEVKKKRKKTISETKT